MSVVTSPHAHAQDSVQKIMLLVCAALLPATLFSFYQFGWPTINLFLITLGATLLGEALSLRMAGKPSSMYLSDGSALLTAWLLAMSLPPWAPWWIGVVGGLFAVVVGKHVFGGIGQNLFNPAMLARTALLISFPLEMTTWIAPNPIFSGAAPGFIEGLSITFQGIANIDAVTGATVLDQMQTDLGRNIPLGTILQDGYSASSSLFGTSGGSMGETSALLILLGGLFLMYKRIISWHIPAAMLGTVAVIATFMHLVDPQRYADAGVHLLSGGLMLGAFFIATDPVGSPSTRKGQMIFAAGCGLLAYVIRNWAGFPEGVAFAVLIMNACTPLIDHYVRPRIYGRNTKGEPLNYQQGKWAKRLATQNEAARQTGEETS